MIPTGVSDDRAVIQRVSDREQNSVHDDLIHGCRYGRSSESRVEGWVGTTEDLTRGPSKSDFVAIHTAM